MPTTTFTMTPAQQRNLDNSLLARAEGFGGQFGTLQQLIDFGVDDLGFPEPLVRRTLLRLRRNGYLDSLEVGV